MKILIIGGMHGNETLGIQLVEKLRTSPIDSVDAIIANEMAVKENVRYTTQDLNRTFPGAEASSTYEEQRAAKLVKLCKQYDIVLDFHNTYCPNNNCSFVGDAANKELFAVSNALGLSRVIVADYDCLNKYAPNCISVEISMDSNENDVNTWYEKIKKLAIGVDLSPQIDIELYRFVYRMTLEDRDSLRLKSQNLEAFKAMDEGLADRLGVKSPAYPIFIADTFTPYNYGGVLNRLPTNPQVQVGKQGNKPDSIRK